MCLHHKISCLLTLGLLALASGCSQPNSPAAASPGNSGKPGEAAPEKAAAAAPQGVPVEVEAATIGPVAAFVSYNSTLEVETAVTVFPEVAGLVERIHVEEGDRVKAGQPLVELEHDELEVARRQSKIDVAQLEQSFARTKELFERGLVNRQEFDTRNFELSQAKLRLERAEIGVEQATVRAPVDGVITERFVQPGARVSGNTQLFGLMSLDDMIARVHVPGRYLTKVHVGQDAGLSSEFLPGRKFSGWVKRISPIVDPSSGTFKVTVGVKPGAEPPPPGLFVTVRIVTDRRAEAVLVPKRGVVYEGGERFVFLVREGKAAKIRLNAGYEEGDFVEAVENVTAGDQVVVLGQNALRDGAAVRIVGADRPTAAIAGPESPKPSGAQPASGV